MLLQNGTNNSITHYAGDSFEMHSNKLFKNATFQVASQFNLLEFITPSSIPENGVTYYYNDHTQGPACALACPAGTVFRNYFVLCNHIIGQYKNNQLNGLDELFKFLSAENLVKIKNGYSSSTNDDLILLNNNPIWSDHSTQTLAKSLIKVGIHSNIEVPWKENTERFVLAPENERHRVTQVYCSALSLGRYTDCPEYLWEPLARLILDASYEATLLTASLEKKSGRGSGVVVLTLLGGGVFGNKIEWIADSIGKAVAKCKNMGLKVVITHYRQIDNYVKNLINESIRSHNQ